MYAYFTPDCGCSPDIGTRRNFLTVCKTAVTRFLLAAALALAGLAWGDGVSAEAQAQQSDTSAKSDLSVIRNPASVRSRIAQTEADKEALFRVPPLEEVLQPWYGLKSDLDAAIGLEVGLFYAPMYQAIPSGPGPKDAAGGTFNLDAAWTFWRDTETPGRFLLRLQDRHAYGNKIPPSFLFVGAGQLWPTTIGHNEFNLSVLEFAWGQTIVKDRFVVAAGKLIPFANHDYFKFKDPFAGFNEATLTLNPTIGFVATGLGAGFGVRPTDDTYLTFGVYDANGTPEKSGFDTLFDRGELFYVSDIGWDPGYLIKENAVFLGDMKISDIHATFWYKDALKESNAPKGWGVSFFAEGEIGDIVPFIRVGFSDGDQGGPALLNFMVAGGVGIQNVFGQKNDLIGIAASYGKREVGTIDTNADNIPDLAVGNVDQLSTELFYRIQLIRELAIRPHLQVTFNPALDPGRDVSALIGIQGKWAM